MKSMILCSGGIKSAFMISLAVREDTEKPILLFVNYGQKAMNQEVQHLVELEEYYGLQSFVLTNKNLVSPTTSLIACTQFLLSVVEAAQEHECYRICFGWSSRSWVEMNDLGTKIRLQNFLTNLSQLVDTIQPKARTDGSFRFQTSFELPLYLVDEKRILRLGNEFRVPWHLTWSCDDPVSDGHFFSNNYLACGQCPGCRRRIQAMMRLGMMDRLKYQKCPLGDRHAE